jgi:3-deoxy-7-phosphoheptulonate synthase
MIIVLRPETSPEEEAAVVELLAAAGAEMRALHDQRRLVFLTPRVDSATVASLLELDFVERVVRTEGELNLVTRAYASRSSIVDVSGVAIGGDTFVVMAGPCAVENLDQAVATASAVAAEGARILRGDAFKPRTSPYSFQGLGEEGLKIMSEARNLTGLPFVAEVLDTRQVELVSSYADMVRIGTRNMANYALLREVGRQPKPVLIKRGSTATVAEWLAAAEYVYAEGNPNIVLVERGIRTFEPATRNTLDLSAVPLVKQESHLPVLVDPSHAVGRADLVRPLALAALAVGADGLMVDVHPDPGSALVDGAQALVPADFAHLMNDLRAMASALGSAL